MLGNIAGGILNAALGGNNVLNQITDFASSGLSVEDQINNSNQTTADAIAVENNAQQNLLAQMKNSAANEVESKQVQGMLKALVDGQSMINDSEQHGRDSFNSFAESIRDA